MNSDKLNTENNSNIELNQIIIKEDDNNKYEKHLLNILTNKDLFNNKKTKIIFKNDYTFLIKLFNNSNEDEFINIYKYLNKINFPIIKILIVGFLEFDDLDKEINENIILEIISKGIDINFNKNIFYYIYKKLSKQYRRHDLLNNIESIKKIDKLLKIWKLLYNISKNTLNKDLFYTSNFIFFPPNSNEDKTFVEINIDDKNEIKNLIISINFVASPILNINQINEKFNFLKLYNDNKEILELKYNDLNIENNDEDISFSKIFKIKFVFSNKEQFIYINKKIKLPKEYKFNFNSVTKVDILNNFIGEVSSVIFKKEYTVFAEYAEEFCPAIQPLKMKIYREIPNDHIQIKTNAFGMFINDGENNIEKINQEFSYQYCGASFSVKINYEKNENKETFIKTEIDLSQIEYLGGLNCFIPLFKIIKYAIDNLELIAKNNPNENNLLEVNKYLDKFLIWIKDILKIILKMVCLSERNYKNFREIVVPLIGSLAEIGHILKSLDSSDFINKNLFAFLFNDEIFSSLYLIILISSYPNNIKKMYRKIVGINKTLNNLNLSIESFIFDIEKNNIKNLDWYFNILIVVAEFIFIFFNCSEKVPYKLINQIKNFLYKDGKEKKEENIKKHEAIKILSNIMYNFYSKENKLNTEDIVEDKNFLNDNNYYLQFIIYMITTFLNSKLMLKVNNIECKSDSYYNKFLNFFENYFKKKYKINITDDYAQMIINFSFFPEQIKFLQQLFPFLKDENFLSPNELIMEELIDYHSQYHHLMKELFVFNRLWSNQKIFFNTSFDKIKKSKLKYKNINYYTRNFQRPIIYPVLDYKHRYPEFSNFTINNDFYIDEEDKDDYNFDLDCPEFDEFIDKYDKEIYKIIENNGKINTCEVCWVKQTHHVKGNLFIFYNNDKIIIYFYSYSFKHQNNEDEILCCNKGINTDNILKRKYSRLKTEYKLCFGSIFKCPKKDANKKIKIKLDDIRLVLTRIYFYRNSALEIFTETKSYYFNFVSEDKRHSLNITFMYPCQKTYFPINIEKNLIGYMKLNQKIIDENNFTNLINQKNNFIDFISDQTSKGELCEMCVFDIIMLINLISNRSFNDLYQYPIFPMLYFYDKQSNISIRDFKEHIGFQEISENLKIRKNMFLQSYQETINEANENYYYNNENQDKNELYCFNTHYSNSIYTSNYLIRLFPHSFSAIEMQGNGFDNPNRLFFSIEDTFFNISTQKSDLRELIPEFFYLPEMFLNINNINFHKRTNQELVDDVIMPKNLKNKNKVVNNIFEYQEVFLNDFNIYLSDGCAKNSKKENFKKCFVFVEDMKNRLENISKDFTNWINIIFGLNQKYSPKNQQYFRTESYISINGNYQKYLKDDNIMNSVEFGLIPLQTIFDNKILTNLQRRKNTYEQLDFNANDKNNKFTKIIQKETKKIIEIFSNIYKSNSNEIIDVNNENTDKNQNKESKDKYYSNEYNDYWDEQLNINFNIDNDNKFGKLEIYKDNILIKEIIDHNDIIIDFYYNRRLNMFATTSYDGFVCIYIYPNKLISMIKHPKNLYFDKVFLSANPFPTIITFEENENIFTTYSLSGMLIKKVKIENLYEDKRNDVEIKPIFNALGGTYKDKIKITVKSMKKVKNEFYSIPFFDMEYKEIINL